MVLTKSDSDLFYSLWFPMLNYVNKTLKVSEELGEIDRTKPVNIYAAMEVANTLWENIDLIDDYLIEKGDIPEEHRNIIVGWKKHITDEFFIERHLKKGSIFISSTNEVYLVSGIISSWEEIFWDRTVPIYVKATLIPFKNVIITDGLLQPYNVVFGHGYKSDLKNIYMSAKTNGTLHKSL